MTILVTGGAGFIGANFAIDWLQTDDDPVVNLDKLTYAGNLGNLAALQNDERHIFIQGDIGDQPLIERLLSEHQPRAIINFAAESHVDRPIMAGASISSYRELITYVKDRPGHDRRYAIDATKIETELDWRSAETFETGIRKTLEWYLDNQNWVEQVVSGDYHRQWIESQYA